MAPQRPGHHRPPRPMNILHIWVAILLIISIVALITTHNSIPHPTSGRGPIRYNPEPLLLDPATHKTQEENMHAVFTACIARSDDVIFFDSNQSTVVLEAEPRKRHCPVLDIILLKPDRNEYNCLIAGIYAVHASARIIGHTDTMTYDASCGTSTARLFLQTLYPSYISSKPGVLHMQWVGAVGPWLQQQGEQAEHRSKVGVFLCPTQQCSRQVAEYILQQKLRAGVWYMGHTALDLSLGVGTFNDSSSSRGGGKVGEMLHVTSGEGEQSQKITGQLLSCWKDYSAAAGQMNGGGGGGDLPPLVALVPPKWRQSQGWVYEGVKGITLVPEKSSTISWPPSHQLVASYQQNISTQIFLSDPTLEPYPTLLDQGRSLGALVVAPGLPPWNELLDESSGVLLKPLVGQDAGGDGRLGRKGGRADTEGKQPMGDDIFQAGELCKGVKEVMKLRTEEVSSRRAAARQRYIQDHGRFLARCQDLTRFLGGRASSTNPMGSLWMNAIAAVESEDPAHPMHTHLLSREFELET